jgi:hypothetical protein
MTDESPSTDLVPHEPSKTNLAAGGNVNAFVPQTLDDAFRLAKAMHLSGLAPTSLGSTEKVMVAIMAGAELGMPPFQSVQSFAVIQGRAVLWGDGMLAVIRSRAFRVKEWFEREGDELIAYCEVTRPDTGEVIKRDFSVADAKKANLWSKSGPWQTNPKRMLQMRARAFACRDGASDVLRGFQMREEVEDYRDITPQKSDLRARLEATPQASEGFTVENAEHVQNPMAEANLILATAEFPVVNQPVAEPAEGQRKRRRTKAEMEAARAAAAGQGAPPEPDPDDPGYEEPEPVEAVVEPAIEPEEADASDVGETSKSQDFSDDLPEPEIPEAATYRAELAMARTLIDVRRAVVALRRTEGFVAAPPAVQRRLTIAALIRLDNLRGEGALIPLAQDDPWYFSLSIVDMPKDAITPQFEALQQSPAWKALTPAQQDGLRAGVARALSE